MHPGGIYVDGRALLPSTPRTLWFVALLLLLGPLAVAVYLIKDRCILDIDWSEVEQVTLDSARRLVCIQYRFDPNEEQPESLAVRLDARDLEIFGELANRFAPFKTVDGVVGKPTAIWVPILLGAIVLPIFGILIWSAFAP